MDRDHSQLKIRFRYTPEQERYGMRVCCLGRAGLNITVAWPPRLLEHARRVAAEHHAFCPDLRSVTSRRRWRMRCSQGVG
ncbi:DUF4253 domain-containing protein [Actinomadura verrucosospora]|nr:DUF4253 domain-containing protein [Actinomadura verrucosospora]